VAEGLANVAKHSCATNAAVTVEETTTALLHVVVEDDGRGGANLDPEAGSPVSPPESAPSMGLQPLKAARRPHPTRNRHPLRVVIADDSALLREGITRILAK
jgi:hypothetical protein